MKSLVLALVTFASLSAHAILDPNVGRVDAKGFDYTCSFYNNTGRTLDFKYVSITFDGPGDNTYTVDKRVDQVVKAGETAVATIEQSTVGDAYTCTFWAR